MFRDFEGSDTVVVRAVGRRVVAVIGINRYQEWPELANAVNDAREAGAAFARLGFDQIDSLLDGDATADAILKLTRDRLAQLAENDSLVVFFAGHGHTETKVHEGGAITTGYIIPADAEIESHSRWLRVDTWLSDLASLAPRHVLVFIDACKSGVALKCLHASQSRPITPATADLADRRSRKVITSALHDQRARDHGLSAGHSLFTGCLLEALGGDIAVPGRSVTGTQLGLFLQERARDYSGGAQTPDFGPFDEDHRGELIIRVPSRGRTPARWVAEPDSAPAVLEKLRTPSRNAWSRAQLDAPTALENVDEDFQASWLALPRLDRAASALAVREESPAWVMSLGGPFLFVGPDSKTTIYAFTVDDIPAGVIEEVRLAGCSPRLLVERNPEREIDGDVIVVRNELRVLARPAQHIQGLLAFDKTEPGRYFVEPALRVRGSGSESLRVAFASWMQSQCSLLLLLGEYAAGKSTALRALGADLARESDDGGRSVVLVDLRGWSDTLRLDHLIARTLGSTDITRIRFAVEEGECVLILDGFDEMTNRMSPTELASAFRELLSWRTNRSKLVLSCRTHLFIDPDELDAVMSEVIGGGLHTALGELRDARVAEVQLFDDHRIREYLQRAVDDPDEVWDLLAKLHDLRDLARRPLLLDLIRSTLPQLRQADTVALGDVYETYLQQWAQWAGAHEWLAPDEKVAVAEVLARLIWRGGRGIDGDAAHWKILVAVGDDTLPDAISRKLVGHAGAQLELRAGSFLVWRDTESGGYYRFAHRSFLEYLLARRVVRDLEAGRAETLDLPQLSREVVAYCVAHKNWNAARRELDRILTTGYQPRISENALLLAARDGTLRSSRERPWRLEGAQLEKLRLDDAVLVGSWLDRTRLGGAQLSGADLSHARLSAADLRDSDLRQAVLHHAMMRTANLQRARIDAAVFDCADLRDAQLDGSSAYDGAASFVSARFARTSVAGTAWQRPVLASADGLVGIEHARWRDDSVQASGDSKAALTLHLDRVADVLFDRTGACIITASHDGRIRIFETRSGRLLRIFTEHAYWVTCLALSNDGATLISGSRDGSVRAWDLASGASRTLCSERNAHPQGVAISRSGEFVAVGGFSDGVRILETASGRLARQLGPQTRGVIKISFLANDSRLLMSGFDHKVCTWDLDTDARLVLAEHGDSVRALAATDDGRRGVSGSDDRTARILDLEQGNAVSTLSNERGNVYAVAISPDGARVVIGGTGCSLWDAESGIEIQRSGTDPVWSLAFSPDGSRIVAGGDAAFAILDAETLRPLFQLDRGFGYQSNVAASHTTEVIASSSFGNPGRIHVWSGRDGRFLRTFAGPSSMPASLVCSHDDRTVLAGTHGGTIEVCSMETGNIERVLVENNVASTGGSSNETVDSLTLSGDGKLLVAGHRGGWIRLWDTHSWLMRRRINAHTGAVSHVAFSRDDRYLATASHDRTARVWDTRTWQPLHRLAWHGSCVSSVAFSPTGDTIATASYDNNVGIWNWRVGRLRRVLKGHTAWVVDVAFLPDGVRVVTGSYDGTLRIWNVTTGNSIATLNGHTGAVTSMSIVGDGSRLVSASVDGTVRLWHVDSTTELATFWPVRDGGVTTAGPYALLSNPADLELFHLRTGNACAPLGLYADRCLSPKLVAAAVSGTSAPPLGLAMDVARRPLR